MSSELLWSIPEGCGRQDTETVARFSIVCSFSSAMMAAETETCAAEIAIVTLVAVAVTVGFVAAT